MSEFQPTNEKNQKSSEKYIDSRESKKNDERVAKRYEQAAEKAIERDDPIEVIQNRIEKSAKTKEQTEAGRKDKPAAEAVMHSSAGMKKHYFEQTLKRTQKKLSAPQRTFSQFVHQPVVETASDIGGATVARPSGLLVGGIFSVLSSLAILYICRHYGYEYNFLIGMAFFVGGFVLGLLLEAVFKLIKR